MSMLLATSLSASSRSYTARNTALTAHDLHVLLRPWTRLARGKRWNGRQRVDAGKSIASAQARHRLRLRGPIGCLAMSGPAVAVRVVSLAIAHLRPAG